jgi:hypothetical protein
LAATVEEPRKERTPRVDWAELLRRTFDFDVFVCVRCGGQRRGLVYLTALPQWSPKNSRPPNPWGHLEDGGDPLEIGPVRRKPLSPRGGGLARIRITLPIGEVAEGVRNRGRADRTKSGASPYEPQHHAQLLGLVLRLGLGRSHLGSHLPELLTSRARSCHRGGSSRHQVGPRHVLMLIVAVPFLLR